MPFSIHTIYRQVFKLWRQRRFRVFLQLINPASSDVLIDIGGYPSFWIPHAHRVKRIDTLNIHEVSWNNARFPNYNIRTLVGDGCSLKMPDWSYNIAFSNSVIEHVGSWERQQQFAQEIRRVAKALWVQTPAYGCPIEPHYMAPMIHYLPRSWQKRLLRWCTVWGWLERPTPQQISDMVETTRLLRKSEMQRLFPDCEILTERLLWVFPKSYIAIRPKPDPSPVAQGNLVSAASSQCEIFSAAKARGSPEPLSYTTPYDCRCNRRLFQVFFRRQFSRRRNRFPGRVQ